MVGGLITLQKGLNIVGGKKYWLNKLRKPRFVGENNNKPFY